MMMNTNNNVAATAGIKLNETFIHLLNGESSIMKLYAERQAARAAAIASEDAYARRRRLATELSDAFTVVY